MKTSVMMNPADTCHYGLSGSEKTGQEVRLDDAFVVKDSPETYGWLLDTFHRQHECLRCIRGKPRPIGTVPNTVGCATRKRCKLNLEPLSKGARDPFFRAWYTVGLSCGDVGIQTKTFRGLHVPVKSIVRGIG